MGGSLLPTLAVGVPGSAPMALFLGAMLLHGVAPGPDLITKKLDLTFLMVWAIVVANIVGGILAYAMAGQLARVVFVRAAILVPMISAVAVVGAVQSSRQWLDLAFLLAIGALGWEMKHARWSRAPMFLAFILTPLVERYFHISTNLHGPDWVKIPAVAVMLAITVLFLLGVAFSHLRKAYRLQAAGPRRLKPVLNLDVAFTLTVLAVAVAGYFSTTDWPEDARLLPKFVCLFAAATSAMTLWSAWWVRTQTPEAGNDGGMHYELVSDFGDLAPREIVLRAARYLALLVGLGLLSWVIGVVAAIPFYVLAAMRLQRESWQLSLAVAFGTGLVVDVMFRRVLDLAWPPALWPI